MGNAVSWFLRWCPRWVKNNFSLHMSIFLPFASLAVWSGKVWFQCSRCFEGTHTANVETGPVCSSSLPQLVVFLKNFLTGGKELALHALTELKRSKRHVDEQFDWNKLSFHQNSDMRKHDIILANSAEIGFIGVGNMTLIAQYLQ